MKRKSIKAAVLVPLLITLFIGMAAMAATAGIMSFNTASNLTSELILAEIDYAENAFLALNLDIESKVKTLAPVISGSVYSQYAQANPREYVVNALTNALLGNDRILAMWTCWEPNAFDGRDSEYVGAPYHDNTGRFVPVVYRDRGGTAIKPLVGYQDAVNGAFYQVPRTTGQEYMTNPYYYDYNGNTELIITYSYPIIVGGRVLGVVAADFSLAGIIKEMNDIKILNEGYIFIISYDGSIATYPDMSKINRHYNTEWLRDFSTEINSLLSVGGYFSGEGYSDTAGRVSVNGGAIEIAGNYWAFCAVVPKSDEQAASIFLLWVIGIIGVSALFLVGIVVYVIVGRSLKQLPKITRAADQIAIGDIEIGGLDTETYPTKNEAILLERAFSRMIESFKSQAYILARIAEGDYTSKVQIRSDKDVINLAIELLLQETLEVLNRVATAGVQVADGSQQIADGAQTLAQGATQQASAVEELSTSMTEIAHKTKENAEKAGRAASLADTIKHNAEKGSLQMNEMMDAVNEINQASQSISKVIKVIDDIAFQTNILALNAAVEAARAGQHGKGFAVVAEEVRNLAAKSAEAAKDTGQLISNSIEKAKLGSRIAGETAASLEDIVSGINESTQIVSDIAISSDEQYNSIKQINVGVEQVAQVVQQNAATAEESAAASEEMSGQSAILHQLIAQFQLRDEMKKGVPSVSGPEL